MAESEAEGMGVSPSFAMLLLCATSRPDRARLERIRQLAASGVDWRRFYWLAKVHQLDPSAHLVLEAASLSDLPETIASSLRRRFEDTSRRNRLMCDELARVCAALEHHGVETSVIKGPIVAEQAYGGLAHRRFADLDLLFRPEQISRACRTLESLGYELQSGAMPRDALEDAIYRGYHWSYVFSRDDGEVEIDAHWSLQPMTWSIPIDQAGLWQRAVRVRVGGAEVRTLAAEDMLLTICLHGAKEHWKRLRFVCDVSEYIVAYPNLDWHAIQQRAQRQGAHRMLLLGAHLASEWLQAPVPQVIRSAAAADRPVRRLAETISQRWPNGVMDPPNLTTLSSVRWSVLDHSRDRWKYLWRTLTRPRLIHARMVRLPKPLMPLYPVIKVVHDYVALPLYLAARSVVGASLRRSKRS